MLYQSKIQLKGHDALVPVSKNAAEQIAAVFADKNIAADHPINIGGRIFFRKGEIKNIYVLPDIQNTKTEEDARESERKERESRIVALRQTPAQKAAKLEMFCLLYKCSVDTDPDSEVLDNARMIQEKFFISNPTRTLCDPSALFSIIPAVSGKKINAYVSAGLTIIERAVARDMYLAG